MADRKAVHTMNFADSDDDLANFEMDSSPTEVLGQPNIPQPRERPANPWQMLSEFDSPEGPPASFEKRPPKITKLVGLAVLLIAYSFAIWAIIGVAPGPINVLALIGWLAVLYLTVTSFMSVVNRPLLEIDSEGISYGLVRSQSSISWFEITRIGITRMIGNSGQVERLTAWTEPNSRVMRTRPFNKMIDSLHGGIVLCELKDFRLTREGLVPLLERYASDRWDPKA